MKETAKTREQKENLQNRSWNEEKEMVMEIVLARQTKQFEVTAKEKHNFHANVM